MNKSDVLAHVEGTLGKVECFWRSTNDDRNIYVMVVKNCPEPGINTFVTNGLSEFPLYVESGLLGQELVFSAQESYSVSDISSFMLSLADTMIDKQRAFHRGEGLYGKTPIILGVGLDSIYASYPVFYPDEFSVLADGCSKISFVLLIPLYKSEYEFLVRNGYEEFESCLEDIDPDLQDLNRTPLFS